MLLYVYLIAITAEAMSGALAAGKRNMDLFGVATLHGPVSAVPQAPTAVTLASMNATTAAAFPAAPALFALVLALAALAGGLVWRSRMRAR